MGPAGLEVFRISAVTLESVWRLGVLVDVDGSNAMHALDRISGGTPMDMLSEMTGVEVSAVARYEFAQVPGSPSRGLESRYEFTGRHELHRQRKPPAKKAGLFTAHEKRRCSSLQSVLCRSYLRDTHILCGWWLL